MYVCAYIYIYIYIHTHITLCRSTESRLAKLPGLATINLIIQLDEDTDLRYNKLDEVHINNNE